MVERGYRERGDRKRVRVEIEIKIERVLIDRGSRGWSEGIKNCFPVRGQQVSERLRGEAMQDFEKKERERGRDVEGGGGGGAY